MSLFIFFQTSFAGTWRRAFVGWFVDTDKMHVACRSLFPAAVTFWGPYRIANKAYRDAVQPKLKELSSALMTNFVQNWKQHKSCIAVQRFSNTDFVETEHSCKSLTVFFGSCKQLWCPKRTATKAQRFRKRFHRQRERPKALCPVRNFGIRLTRQPTQKVSFSKDKSKTQICCCCCCWWWWWWQVVVVVCVRVYVRVCVCACV